jgi:hypothetical protein
VMLQLIAKFRRDDIRPSGPPARLFVASLWAGLATIGGVCCVSWGGLMSSIGDKWLAVPKGSTAR